MVAEGGQGGGQGGGTVSATDISDRLAAVAKYIAESKKFSKAKAEAIAYGESLRALRDNSMKKIEGYQDEGEGQFLDNTAQAPAEFQAVQNDIIAGQTEAQDNMNRYAAMNLARQGVRGGQAATLQNRQVGELNQNMQRDSNELMYQDARERRNQRSGYFSQKGLMPWQTMSDVNSYMPSAAEVNNMFKVKSSIYRGDPVQKK